MKNAKLIVLTVLSIFTTNAFAQKGTYSTRTISSDGKTSTWAFDVVTGSAVTIADNTDDNGIIYVNGGGTNKAQTSKYMSFNKSELYIEVPAGSAGNIGIVPYSTSDGRYFQLYINGAAGTANQRIWSKAGDGTDGKKGPQSFNFTSADITSKNSKSYLHLKTNNSEMKITSFTVVLTTGSYFGGGEESGGEDPDPGTDPDPDPDPQPQPSSGLYFWFFNAADATANGVTNDATVFSNMVSSGSNKSGTITIDGTNYTVTKRTGDNATFGSFTIPTGNTATFYALAISSGDGARQINLANGSTTFELEVAGGSDTYKQIEQTNIPAGTYSIDRAGGNVRLGVVVLKFIGGEEPPTPQPVPVTGVSLDKTSITIEQGQTDTLKATVTPENADNKAVTWLSGNTAVASVDANGIVTAVGEGSTTITVKTVDQELTATCTVTVTAPAMSIPVTGISIKKSTTLTIGATETLTVTYEPANANTGKTITSWVSSDESVATVDANGTVTAVAEGSAYITATSEGGFTSSCVVTVQAVAVTGVTLNKTSLTLKEEGTETLLATVSPDNATNKGVTWSSDNTFVATVDANGKVTAVAEGSATITVKTVDGNKTATCAVTVEAKSQSGLTVHAPEKYEESKAKGGYEGTLSTFQNRNYEVYYINRDGDNLSVATTSEDKKGSITTSSDKQSAAAKDGWFTVTTTSNHGGDTNASVKDEFTKASTRSISMKNEDEIVLRVKGFDQFSIYGKDNSTDKDKFFHVYIDDELQQIQGFPKASYDIRRYDMSTGEHTIKVAIKKDVTSSSKLTGFSLRVSNDPLVRLADGPKSQTVYQTKEIERVAFIVRRAASRRITWISEDTIPGVSLVDGTNDSVFVEGIADGAAGVYSYKLEALDAAGSVASFETAKITIATHVFDNRTGNDLSTNIGEAIKPLNFIYYASEPGLITLQWNGNPIHGLNLSYSRDSIATLSGTPNANNAEGTYSYSIVAAGGNTITGTITLIVPGPYFEPFEEAKIKDNRYLLFSVKAMHASNITAADLPDWMSCNYDAATGIATFSGTPNVGSPYPKEFPYTLTATPKYQGKEAATETSKIIVIDPNLRTILLVCKDLDKTDDEPIAKYLKGKGYDLTLRQQDKIEGSSMEAFDMLLISENVDANNEAVLRLIVERPKPVLNMKAFTYVYARDEETPNGWGEADNGSLTDNGRYITVEHPEHPIIKNMNMGKKRGDKIEVLSQIDKKGLMPINIFRQGTYCLATALTRSKTNYNGDGEEQTFLHEEPAGMTGGNKYICMPIALSSSEHLAGEGKKLLESVVTYLLSEESAVLQPVDLKIESFSVDGVLAEIEHPEGDSNEGSIIINIDTTAHPINARQIVPQIKLASEYAHVKPVSGDTVDMYWSTFMPVAYVVTDYINRYVYNATLNVFDPRGIEEVEYEAGMWVNIFDIYGRKVTTSNEDIHSMDLPRGIYIVVTENGHSLKIMR